MGQRARQVGPPREPPGPGPDDLPAPRGRRGLRAFLRRARMARRRGTSVSRRHGALAYAWRYASWRVRGVLGPSVGWSGPEGLTAVLLSFARPENMQGLVRACLRCRFVERLVVSNNHPGVRVGDWVRVRDPRLRLLDQPVAAGPIKRYEIARDEPGERFLFLDDDLFLEPRQIRDLFARLLEDPSVPHGVFGQRLVDPGSERHEEAFRNGVHSLEGEVDVLNRAYLLTRAHVRRFWDLAGRVLEEDPGTDLSLMDDLVVSLSGSGRPRIHDVGAFLDCPSQGDPRISVWARPGVGDLRLRTFLRLRALRSEARPPSAP